MRRAYESLGIQCPTSAPTGLVVAPGQTTTRPGVRMPGPGGPMPGTPTVPLGTVRLAPPPGGQPAPNVSLSLGSDGAAQAQQGPQQQQTAANSLQQNLNMQLFNIGGNGETPGQAGIVSTYSNFVIISHNTY